jgi:hypothetical protein
MHCTPTRTSPLHWLHPCRVKVIDLCPTLFVENGINLWHLCLLSEWIASDWRWGWAPVFVESQHQFHDWLHLKVRCYEVQTSSTPLLSKGYIWGLRPSIDLSSYCRVYGDYIRQVALTVGFIGFLVSYTQLQPSPSGLSQSHNRVTLTESPLDSHYDWWLLPLGLLARAPSDWLSQLTLSTNCSH